MTRKQIDELIANCGLPDSCEKIRLIETHISWVILTDHFAFKLKKPVKFPFLDFSTRKKREHYCREEIRLNRRLAPEMYLDMIRITPDMLHGNGKETTERPIDYAVQMKQMDNSLEMDRLLKENKVNMTQMDTLAEKIAAFHKTARIIKNAFDTTGFQERYADLSAEIGFVKDHLGAAPAKSIENCIEVSNAFLNASRSYFNQRIITNFRRDCHGDLKASNIFLYEDPVIFDCIEFNSEYRYIDVLNEIAFLCVDLDYYGHPGLADAFYRKYLESCGMEEDEASRRLFTYYKDYRANIRAKTTAISARQQGSNEEIRESIRRYIDLMESYSREHGSGVF